MNAELKYKAEQVKEFCSDVNNATALSIREVRRDECRAKIIRLNKSKSFALTLIMKLLKAYARLGGMNAELKYKSEQVKEFCSDVNNVTA